MTLPKSTLGTRTAIQFHPNNTMSVRGRGFGRLRDAGDMYPGSAGNFLGGLRVLYRLAMIAASPTRRSSPYGAVNIPEALCEPSSTATTAHTLDYMFTASP